MQQNQTTSAARDTGQKFTVRDSYTCLISFSGEFPRTDFNAPTEFDSYEDAEAAMKRNDMPETAGFFIYPDKPTTASAATTAQIHPKLGDLCYFNNRKFKSGQIIARLGRHFVQKSVDQSWPKFAIFGANPSRWLDTAREAVDMMILICEKDTASN